MEKLTYNVTEAAEVLGVSRPTMYQLIHRADFPTLKVGNRRLISRELLADWVRRQAGGQEIKSAAPVQQHQGGRLEQTSSKLNDSSPIVGADGGGCQV